MGRPPAYLFVVRHGYRLDAADKQWHLSSPTPYDPPLTYSGWQQAKSLGVRIASIIRERVQEEELAASRNTDPSAKRKRKRYEVVLHSSPFLRCIQTSIAISAGLAQDSTPFGPAKSAPSIRKSVLRLDAFLGEWLSPSYFEFITPPPESVMMLASAKADLLRREDYSHYPNFVSHHHSNSQGQLWSPTGQSNGFGLPAGSSLRSGSSNQSSQKPQTPTGYVSPVPHYAVSNNNTIPPGYVSHARDACVDIDYQWDSTRGAVDWGDGGEFPEEWAAMHKRFRAGAQSLVDWYSTAEHPTRPVTKSVNRAPTDDDADEPDVEIEAVVILVSHGAGCNALIGAITHQPVLMDVGMASLTMAVHKPLAESPSNRRWPEPRSPSGFRDTPPMHELYELKLFANSDHLRSPSGTPTSSRHPSMSSAMNFARGRHLSFSNSSSSSADFSWNEGGSRNSSANAALSGLRREANNALRVPRLSFAVSTEGYTTSGGGGTSLVSGSSSTGSGGRPSIFGRGTGLWTPAASRDEDDDDEDDMLPNFGNAAPKAAANTLSSSIVVDGGGETSVRSIKTGEVSAERSPRPEPEQLGAGAGGLWGAPRPPDDADLMRDMSSVKRRWTVTDHT
ncbi:hypothetical protein VTI74DRAFT_2463 [Chaetomium olivicolor]